MGGAGHALAVEALGLGVFSIAHIKRVKAMQTNKTLELQVVFWFVFWYGCMCSQGNPRPLTAPAPPPAKPAI